ncbi:hypothetical protein ASC80_05785 [Afipia sp. Root123D2]|nr:hypothetical protein ASC80_05785 [Afipia sp. Root123D2]
MRITFGVQLRYNIKRVRLFEKSVNLLNGKVCGAIEKCECADNSHKSHLGANFVGMMNRES